MQPDSTRELEWLAEQGARFALPSGRTKNKFEKDWPNKPHNLQEAIRHTNGGGNAGILTGRHSNNIVAVDRDVDFEETVIALGDFGKTAKIIRNNALGRGKFIYRIAGDLPPTISWKPEGEKHPHAEFLGDNGQRHALCPPSIYDGGNYVLLDKEYGIKEITPNELDCIWRLITGGSIYKNVREQEHEEAKTPTGGDNKTANDDYLKSVLAYWTTRKVFDHFNKTANGTKREGSQLRILGNGGLLLGANNEQWSIPGDNIGGGPIQAYTYCKWGKVIKPKGKEFWEIINSMADDAGIPKPVIHAKIYTNGSGPRHETESCQPSTCVDRRTYTQLLAEMQAKSIREYDENFAISCLFNGEEGDARLLSNILKHNAAYDHSEGIWYWYNNLFWEPDKTWNIYQLTSDILSETYKHLSVKKHAESIDLEKALLANDNATQEQRDELKKIISVSKAAKGRSVSLNAINDVKRVLSFACSGLRLGVTGDEWDSNVNLLGVQNGVIDLITGEPVPARADYYIRTVAPVPFVQGAQCPLYEKSIVELFDGNSDNADYVQRLLGYAMSGTCLESDFPIWFGKDGRNGKEFILERIRNVLGEKLAGVAESELLLSSKTERGKNSATEGLMVLRGRRIAWASETNEGRMLDLASMKDLSGGHVLTGRHNHGRQVEWKRTHTLILLTNHRPHIQSQALAEWDRVRLLEFPLSFVNEPDPEKPNQRKKDKTLGERIDRDELPGILNWLIAGCLAWRCIGLNEPESVKKSTAQYKADEDTLGFFISETCVLRADTKCKPSDLYRVYVEWIDRGGKPMGKKTFYGKIEERGFKRSGSHGIEYFFGIGILNT